MGISDAADDNSLRLNCDRLEILNLLAGSAMSSDVASELFQRRLYDEHAVLDRGPSRTTYQGRDAIAAIMRDEEHLARIRNGMVHFSNQPYLRVSGDSAVACGYLQIARVDPAASSEVDRAATTELSLWMITANVWRFARVDGQWRIVSRTIRDALAEEGRALIRAVIEDEGDLQ